MTADSSVGGDAATPVPLVLEQSADAITGAAIRRERESRGWTQAQLSTALKPAGLQLDTAAITRIEQGQRSLRVAQLERFASVLGVSMRSLVGDPKPTPGVAAERAAAQIDLAFEQVASRATTLLQAISHGEALHEHLAAEGYVGAGEKRSDLADSIERAAYGLPPRGQRPVGALAAELEARLGSTPERAVEEARRRFDELRDAD